MRKNPKKNGKGLILMAGGLLLTAAALLLTCYNLWDDARAGKEAREILEQFPLSIETGTGGGSGGDADGGADEPGQEAYLIPDYILYPDKEMPVVEVDGNEYIGILEIPALELALPVMSEWSYPKLKTAPCRYAGTAYAGGFVIAGHNYRTHFTPLKNLEPGAQIRFTDVDGNVFSYETVLLETLEPEEVDEMTDKGWDLTLFTCTYGGQARLAVRCSLVHNGL